MLIFGSSAIYSIISLVFVIVGSCMILFILEIEFLSFILLLVYIGAIAVLFLFVVLLLQLNKEETVVVTPYTLNLDSVLAFLILCKAIGFIFILNKSIDNFTKSFSYEYLHYNEDIVSFSNPMLTIGGDSIVFLNLFTQKYTFFVIVGLTLLFSMVASIALCVKNKNV